MSPAARIVIGLACLWGLLFAEAFYQRRLHRINEFKASLEAMSASLGDLQIAFVSMTQAYTEVATAMSQVRREAEKKSLPPQH